LCQWPARKLPATLLFVPSIGGISHHWSEHRSDEDTLLGTQVFTGTILDAIQTTEGEAGRSGNMSGS
jgi:N-carbamoyl-L-amino-acid hydrolase